MPAKGHLIRNKHTIKDQRLVVWATDETVDFLDMIAKHNGTSRSAAGRQLIKDGIDRLLALHRPDIDTRKSA